MLLMSVSLISIARFLTLYTKEKLWFRTKLQHLVNTLCSLFEKKIIHELATVHDYLCKE